MTESNPSFTTADYVVFSISLSVSLLIGVYQWYKSRGHDSKDFFMGGGLMSPLPVGLSLVAGIVSAISILGNSSEMYYYGSQLWMTVFGGMIGAFLVALLIIPVIYPLGIVSIFEYLELRWGIRTLRLLTTIVQQVNMFIYMGIALYAPSMAISSITPISTTTSIISLGIVCGLYSSFGGAKAVVYTDTFQMLIMFSGVIAVIVQGCIEVGGGSNAWQIDKEHGRIEFFNMSTDPLERYTLISVIILGTSTAFSVYGTSQSQFQRWASVGTLRQSYFVMFIGVVGLVALWSLINYSGLVVFSVYVDCDPLKAGYIEKLDQILMYFVMDKLGYLPGIPGLFVAAVYSGVLSTVSSNLNALAAMMWKDLLQPLKMFSGANESKAKRINMIISLVSSVVAILLGLLAGSMGGLVQVSYAIIGALGGPITGLFLTAIICPWVKAWTAFVGVLCSLTLTLWIMMGNFLYADPPTMLPLSTDGCPAQNTTLTTTLLPITTDFPPHLSSEVFPLYRLSYCLYGTIGILTTLVMSSVASCVLGFADPRSVPRNTVNRTCLRFYCWLRGVDLFERVDKNKHRRTTAAEVTALKLEEGQAQNLIVPVV